jgi:hypothetical protein
MSTSAFGLQPPVSQAIPDVTKCDVSDFKLLRKYRAKRAEWLRWYEFEKNEPNNIQGQIIRMVFLEMGYRVLSKPRGDVPTDVKIAARNPLLAHMLDLGYAATQVLAIRRLLARRTQRIFRGWLLKFTCRCRPATNSGAASRRLDRK